MKRPIQGQSMTEVLLVSAALAVSLLLPFMHGKSVATVLLEALLGSLRAQVYLLSIL